MFSRCRRVLLRKVRVLSLSSEFPKYLSKTQNMAVTDFSDLIATGGSAAAAGELIAKSGGKTLEYLFIISLPFLNGDKKLDAPSYWLIEAED